MLRPMTFPARRGHGGLGQVPELLHAAAGPGEGSERAHGEVQFRVRVRVFGHLPMPLCCPLRLDGGLNGRVG